MKIALFTNEVGILQFENKELCKSLNISAVIAASNRPQNHDPLKEFAKKFNSPFFSQPKYNTNTYYQFLDEIKNQHFTHFLVNSYSMLLRPDLLSIVENNAINIHWSLLPKNRGPNPIQWSIIKDENETGVTFHQITDGFDEGPIIKQRKIKIDQEDTWLNLRDKLFVLSQEMIENDLFDALHNIKNAIPQNNHLSTANFRLKEEYPEIHFDKMSDRQIYNLIRAQIFPLNGAFIKDHSGRKIFFKNKLSLETISKIRQLFYKKCFEDITDLVKVII